MATEVPPEVLKKLFEFIIDQHSTCEPIYISQVGLDIVCKKFRDWLPGWHVEAEPFVTYYASRMDEYRSGEYHGFYLTAPDGTKGKIGIVPNAIVWKRSV